MIRTLVSGSIGPGSQALAGDSFFFVFLGKTLNSYACRQIYDSVLSSENSV